MNKMKKLLISVLACCSVGLATMASIANTNNEPVVTHAANIVAAPVPKKTIGEVLNTVPGGFPTSLNDFIPGDAWRNEKDKPAYIYYGTDFVFGVMLQEWVTLPLSFELEASGNTYTWTNEYTLTVNFNMEDSVLVSIELVKNPDFPDLNGIYTPSDSSIHSVSDVIATYEGFPSSRNGDDTWLNGENVCYFSDELCLFDGIVEYSVPGGAQVTKVGDNYTCESNGTLVFEMLDGKLNAITFATDVPAYEELIGTYKKAYKINFVVNDPATGILSAEHQRATEGSHVRLFIHPNQGYYFDRVEGDYEGFEVLDGEYNSKYFVMPGHEVTLTAYFASSAIASISMKSNPTKTEYLVGEDLDLTGAQITVVTEGGATADLDVTLDMVSGYDSSIIGEQTITVTFEGKTTSFKVTVKSTDNPTNKKGLNPGVVAGITIGSILGFFIILFAVLYILWKLKDINVPFIKKILTPAFRWITNLLFKTKLNNVEKKDAEEKQMSEEDYLKALKEGTLNK